MKTVGIVLAGGLSRRFGSPKAFAKFEGQYFYQRALDVLSPVCDEIVIVTRPELITSFSEKHTIITDVQVFSGFGPLAGILSAMEFVQAGRYIVLPCDMPHLDQSVIKSLLKRHKQDVTAVKVIDRHHPLVSIWSPDTKGMLFNALMHEQLSVMKLLEKLKVEWVAGKSLVHNEEHVFKNINTISDLERGYENDNNHR